MVGAEPASGAAPLHAGDGAGLLRDAAALGTQSEAGQAEAHLDRAGVPAQVAAGTEGDGGADALGVVGRTEHQHGQTRVGPQRLGGGAQAGVDGALGADDAGRRGCGWPGGTSARRRRPPPRPGRRRAGRRGGRRRRPGRAGARRTPRRSWHRGRGRASCRRSRPAPRSPRRTCRRVPTDRGTPGRQCGGGGSPTGEPPPLHRSSARIRVSPPPGSGTTCSELDRHDRATTPALTPGGEEPDFATRSEKLRSRRV